MKFLASSSLFKALSCGRPGPGAMSCYAFMILVAGWIFLQPLVPAVADSSLRRMHLATESFPAFALQQISPAMYNFSNQGWQLTEDLSMAQWLARQPDTAGYFNHFPVRNLTWTERAYMPADGVWGLYRSSYRGRELQTKYRLQPASGAGWDVVRLESKFTDEQP